MELLPNNEGLEERVAFVVLLFPKLNPVFELFVFVLAVEAGLLNEKPPKLVVAPELELFCCGLFIFPNVNPAGFVPLFVLLLEKFRDGVDKLLAVLFGAPKEKPPGFWEVEPNIKVI